MSPEEYEAYIVKGLEALPKEDLIEKEICEERLKICSSCERLNSGTCLACGCYVELRAALKKGKCPYKKW